jgi:L-threonylcarbamoyladenylate synthase
VGGLSVEEIESVIGKVTVNTRSESNPQAPGQLGSHYAPKKPLLLGDIHQLYLQNKTKSMAVMSFREEYELANVRTQIVLSPSGNLDEAARKLFSVLRELDKLEVEIILTEEVPEIGLGRAINDRLRRASTNF